MENYLNTYKNS